MQSFKVCLIGSYGVGKTSVTQQYVSNNFSDKYLTTIGLTVKTKKITVQNQEVKLVIWDIAGRDELNVVEFAYLKGSDAVLYIADGTRAKTLQSVFQMHEEIEENIDCVNNYLFLNKHDMHEQWDVTDLQLKNAREKFINLYLTSAKKNVNIDEAFLSLATELIKTSA